MDLYQGQARGAIRDEFQETARSAFKGHHHFNRYGCHNKASKTRQPYHTQICIRMLLCVDVASQNKSYRRPITADGQTFF